MAGDEEADVAGDEGADVVGDSEVGDIVVDVEEVAEGDAGTTAEALVVVELTEDDAGEAVEEGGIDSPLRPNAAAAAAPAEEEGEEVRSGSGEESAAENVSS